MGDLSEHFSRWEFRCRGENCCGHSGPVDERLVSALEELRRLAGERCGWKDVPIHVDSGYRCHVHNREVGSVDASFHCIGMAADIRTGMLHARDLALLADSVEAFHQGGIGS